MDEVSPRPGANKPDKAVRLAEALRENLRKRKAQSRARRGGAGIGAGISDLGKVDLPEDDGPSDTIKTDHER